MNTNHLFKKLTKPISKKDAVKIALNMDCSAKDLIEFSLNPLNEFAFRSSWILEQVFYLRKDSFILYIENFIAAYFQQENHSCQRHFTKIMMTLTQTQSNNFQFDCIDKSQNQIIETTFDWLINPKTPVAVKANCMDILMHLSRNHVWIADELCSQVQFLLKDGSAAIQSRGKRILDKLKC